MDIAIKAGEKFPTLEHLGDLAGLLGKKPVVLYFYPKANTGG